MIRHADIDRVKLRQLIDSGGLRYGGNARLKIYGTLQCTSGKRMVRETRVFLHPRAKQSPKSFGLAEIVCERNIKPCEMQLFNEEKTGNLLPCDGVAEYYGNALSRDEERTFFDVLLKSIDWKPDEVVIAGKSILTKRLVAWYGDSPYSYTYSGTTKQALAWTDELLELRTRANSLTGDRFNSCLLNLYHDGTEGVGWHSDNEDCFIKNATIASFSLGAERKFSFKHRKTKETITIELGAGSLLAMKGETQIHWVHSLPKSVTVTEPRINLTFRRIRDGGSVVT